MPHFRVDDGLDSHPKIERAGDDAIGMWTRAGSWCMRYLTDGFVPEWWVKKQPNGTRKARKLVAVGLWIDGQQRDGERGYQFHDFVGPGRQDSREKVEADRELARKRKQKSRMESQEESQRDTPRDGHRESRQESRRSPGYTQPNPTQQENSGYVQTPRHQSNAREPDGRGKALARVRDANLTARSLDAYRIAEAFSASSAVPIEGGLLSGIGVQIDKCLKRGIPPPAIAAGLQAWTASDSWSPTQIPNFVHKANNRGQPTNGKPTTKALGYDDALAELLQEVTTL
jgi:hypothetical protein